MRLLVWLLRLYPRAWRQRYEKEMMMLLERHRISVATIADLLLGALDARLDPYYRTESPLFALKGRHSLAIIFISSLAAFTYASYFWLVGHLIQVGWSIIDDGTVAVGYAQAAIFVTLIVSCLPIFFSIIKKDIAARRKTSLIIRASCMAFPFFLVKTFFPFSRPELYLHNLKFLLVWLIWFLGLEIIMGCLYTTITQIGKAFAAGRKKLVFLVLCISLLMPLSLFLYDMSRGIGWMTGTTFDLMTMTLYMLPFACLGTLLLTVANSEMSKRTFSRALVPAALLLLTMMIVLIASITWVLTSLIPEYWFLFNPILGDFRAPWNNSIFMCTVVMALALGIALVAFLRSLGTLATPRQRSEEARLVQMQRQL